MINLCEAHKQEPNQSHYAPHNCDYCKLMNALRDALSLNCQPPVKRWWFCTCTLQVWQTILDYSSDGDMIEVTADYAAYLSEKPDGEWELRRVELGDRYLMIKEKQEVSAYGCPPNIGPHDRGYRWCKPRPKMGWVEYPVVVMDGEYVICYNGGHRLRLYEAANRVGYKETVRDENGIPTKVVFWQEVK